MNDIPAPNLSDSYSFNEKMVFLKNNNFPVDYLAIGSSLTLNNINSQTIIDELHTKSYLNTASWGMSMKDDFYFLKYIALIYKPKILIKVSNTIEFSLPDKNIKYQIIVPYLTSTGYMSSLYHLKFFNLKYYLANFKYAKWVRECKNDYNYLGFDKYGGVNFDTLNFRYDSKRWNSHLLKYNFLDYQYQYLDSISHFCNQFNIKLFFIQSPYRIGLQNNFDLSQINKLNFHINKIDSIQKKKTSILSIQI